jgi:hypothetical protein
MRVDRCGRLLAAFGLVSLLAAAPIAAAEASQRQVARPAAKPAAARQVAIPQGGLQCVPYARQISGIDITGNAHTWWHQAEGRYQRAARPENGAVLVFRSSGGMRLGHVSVVSSVVSSRHILVDHANWPGPGFPKGRVARGVSMVDVSDDNDWTAVRVEIHGQRDGFGRIYPTYGFVLPRTADGGKPPPLAPITEARARLDERAARAASRPAGYVGRGADLADAVAAEIGDARPLPPTMRGSTATGTNAAPQVRVAMAAPRDGLVDDELLFAAPDRSLR